MDTTGERILQAALSLFASRGYDSVSVQDVCDASGVTKPTLYYHFGSKRGLMEALGEELYTPFLGELRAACAYRGDLRSCLRETLGLFLRTARERPDFARFRASLAVSPPASEQGVIMADYGQALAAALEETFASAAQDHGNMKGRERAYAASFLGVADAYAALVLRDAFTWEADYIDRLLHYFMHGIFS